MSFMALVIVCSAALSGGKLARIGDIRVRWSSAIVVCLGAQILISSIVPDAPRPVLVACHLATYAGAAAVVWANRALPGLVVLGLGALCNATVIALNGGTLPASASALADAGWARKKDFANSAVLPDPVLPWLGDVVATPAWLPFRNVISVGDVLILVGAFVLVHWTSRSRVARVVTRGCRAIFIERRSLVRS